MLNKVPQSLQLRETGSQHWSPKQPQTQRSCFYHHRTGHSAHPVHRQERHRWCWDSLLDHTDYSLQYRDNLLLYDEAGLVDLFQNQQQNWKKYFRCVLFIHEKTLTFFRNFPGHNLIGKEHSPWNWVMFLQWSIWKPICQDMAMSVRMKKFRFVSLIYLPADKCCVIGIP